MTKTLTGMFSSADTARNAFDDLIGTGYAQENVYLDRENAMVKVRTPNDTEREVREILGRHQPTEVTERPA